MSEYRIEHEKQDWVRFIRYLQFKSKRFTLLYIFITAIAILWIVAIVLKGMSQESYPSLFFILASIVLNVYPYYFANKMHQAYQKSGGYTLLRLDEDGIMASNTRENYRVSWDMLLEMKERKNELILHYENGLAHLILKRCIDVDKFKQEVQTYRTLTR